MRKSQALILAGALLAGTQTAIICHAQERGGSVAPSQAAGYELAFSDDFDTLNISPDGTGNYTWYRDVWFSHKHAPPSNIRASSSELSLNWVLGQPTHDTSIETLSQDKLHARTWRYGYYEIRAKWDTVRGAWPAFWLIPVQDATRQDVYAGMKESGELDIFEGEGARPHLFFGTIHDWINGQDHANSPNHYPLPEGVDLSRYHTYGLLWVPGIVTWYLDNQALHSEPTPAIFDKQDFFLVLSMQEGINWKAGDVTGLKDPKLSLSIDWVRVWQK